MSCLDNTDILRIVGGNSFQIAITVKARRVSDGSEIEDFDLSASSPVLNLIHAGEKTRKYFVTQGNQAIISFDGSEGLGYYGMEMSGSYNSEAWRFCIEKVLQLVDTNAKANIPEWSFLVDDTYFIEGTISIYGGGGGGDTVQADWTETSPTSAAFILHKPDLSVYATKMEVASGLAGKQDTIGDLSAIREGAAAGATAYQKPSSGIPESDMSDGVQSALDKAEDAYQLPASGIPASDMDSEVQASLEKANSAVQTETDPVFSNSPAAEISQNDINSWNAKQSAINDLADIREGAAAGATAVQPDEMAQAIDGVEGDIDAINAKIPAAASNLNQLADKAYVNSSIATNSATYRGSFNLITDLGMNVDATHAQIAGALATAIVTADNNDYAFVQIPDSASTPTVIAKIERYKHNGSGWVYEYDLNNSGFTAAQWAAINSGITSGLVGKLADLPNNSELATLLNGKQNVISDLSAIRSGAAAGATAVQPADLTEALNGVEDEIAGLDESKQDVIEDLSTIRSGASAGATAYQKPASGIPESDMSGGVQTSLGKADSAYQKPVSGIPATDMSEGVQAALEKANSAVQTETDPVFSNSPAAEISQNDINSWNAKQSAIADLADIREGAAAGATAVQPDEMAQAIDEVDGDIDAINAKIPSAASNLNQLADKAYVNSSIATNSATYRGSFNLITDLGMNVDATHAQIAGALATAITTADNNDYAFVQIPDSASTPTVIAKIERYKHNGSGWVYEYDLNNSGFTAAQWAAINSGITSGLVGKLADLPNNSELATLLNGKQNVISDLSAIRTGASAGATAVQPADLTDALNDVEAEIAGLDESKQDVIEDLSTIRSGAAAGATAYQKPGTGIPDSDMSDGVQTSLGKADSAYQKPSSGIPATDMDAEVQAALEKANSAVQTETDPVFSNSPAADITQADINTWNAKQPAIVDLSDIRAGAAAGATAVQPDEMAQAIDEVDGDIADINAKIPAAASNLNQLADKSYVNSSIATNSATYRGSFNLITDLGMNVDATHAQIAGALATAIVTADNNDYAFVQIPDSASTPTVIAKIERYKHNGSGWVYEYDLNNSGFTAAQWAAINSGITSGLVGKLADLPNNSELATLLNGKQNVINDLSAIRSGAAAGATAYQKPSSGIPASDMSSTVQQELSKANTAVQPADIAALDGNPSCTSAGGHVSVQVTEVDGVVNAVNVTTNDIASASDLAGEVSRAQGAEAALDAEKADKATTLYGYGITNAYTKSEVDGMVSTPHQNYVTVPDYASLPATGSSDTIYRVSCWDGAYNSGAGQVDNTKYTEYAWNGTAYVLLRVVDSTAEVFDISAYNNATYDDLTDALGVSGANVPADLRAGGMSVKFINSTTGKYEQWRLMSTTWSTTVSNWQGVDDMPTSGSSNLVKSGGVANLHYNKIQLAQSNNVDWTKVIVRAFVKNWTGGDKRLCLSFCCRNESTYGSRIRLSICDSDFSNETPSASWLNIHSASETVSGIEILPYTNITEDNQTYGQIRVIVNWNAIPNGYRGNTVPNYYLDLEEDINEADINTFASNFTRLESKELPMLHNGLPMIDWLNSNPTTITNQNRTLTPRVLSNFLLDMHIVGTPTNGCSYGIFRLQYARNGNANYSNYIQIVRINSDTTTTQLAAVSIGKDAPIGIEKRVIDLTDDDGVTQCILLLNWDALDEIDNGESLASRFDLMSNGYVFNQVYIFDDTSGLGLQLRIEDKIYELEDNFLSEDEVYTWRTTNNLLNENNIVLGKSVSIQNNKIVPMENQYTTLYGYGVIDLQDIRTPFDAITISVNTQTNAYMWNFAIGDKDLNVVYSSMGSKRVLPQTLSNLVTTNARYIYFDLSNWVTLVNNNVKVMVNVGSTALPYEPYKSPKLFLPYGSEITEQLDARITALEHPDSYLKITIPDIVYAIVDTELNLWNDAISLSVDKGLHSPMNYQVRWTCSKGLITDRCFRYTPVAADAGSTISCTCYLYDMNNYQIGTKTFSIKVRAKNALNSPRKIVYFGDSLGGAAATQLYNDFNNSDKFTGVIPTMLGTRGTTVHYEAVGGYKWMNYATAGEVAYRIYVSGVTSVSLFSIYSDGSHNFEVIEVNLTDGVGNLLIRSHYTSYGTLIMPSGTLTKISGSGDASIPYVDAFEESGNPLWNDQTNQLDIEQYKQMIGLQSTDKIDAVSFQFGVNESFGNLNIEQIAGYIDDLYHCFVDDNPNCKFIIGLTTSCGNDVNGAGINYGASCDTISYVNNVYSLRQFYLGLQSDANYPNIRIAPIALEVDRYYGYNFSTRAISQRTSTTEQYHNNYVHPGNDGYGQMGDAYFATYIGVLTE